jgi:hypothetical protein
LARLGFMIVKLTDLTGYYLFHNYIGPHMGLNGKTPSEVCGITVQGQDKWKTLIQNAGKNNHN